MKNLTGTPYHVENQRYMYAHEHGKEVTSFKPDYQREGELKDLELKKRISQAHKIIRLVKENYNITFLTKKYYLGERKANLFKVISSDETIMAIDHVKWCLVPKKLGRVKITFTVYDTQEIFTVSIRVVQFQTYCRNMYKMGKEPF